ncbi:MAG: hypothetical protein HY047_03215 [Acidobacteria bacterium]|nr:hypothetical protein [Acidobacteriota bacterium]
MTMDMEILDRGTNEELKLGVHAAALGLAVVMGLYNAAAFLKRRERHLAVNTVLYAALTAWEQQHVVHHWTEIQRARGTWDVPGESEASETPANQAA